MLASAARLLHLKRDRLAGSVRFMFQPGEEGWGGAKIMLEEGLLDAGDTPKAVFALHVLPEFPAGTIGCRTGPILAAADTILARIIGHGGHGSAPHEASDPIPPTCEIVQAIQTFITRQFSVFDPVVATVGRIQAGTTNNIIPEFSELDITLRSLSSDSRDQLSKGIQKLINQITIAHGLSAEITGLLICAATISRCICISWGWLEKQGQREYSAMSLKPNDDRRGRDGNRRGHACRGRPKDT